MTTVMVFANDHTSIFHFRRELLERLLDDGLEVYLVLPVDERNGVFAKLGCSVVEIPLSRFGTNPFRELATVLRLVHMMHRVRPDVLLTFTAKPNIYGGLASQVLRVPLIGAVTGLGSTFQTRGRMRSLMTRLYRLAFRRASTVFFENSANRQFLIDRHVVTSTNSVVVAGAGVNLSENQFVSDRPNDGVTRFITVARIRRDKGYGELVAAIHRVLAAHQAVEFHVVGWAEDPVHEQTIEALQTHPAVTVYGSVSQERVRELLQKSDCLIHPSHHEGMSNAVLEASAAGTPSIASDIPGCRESITDGVTGFLFPVRDPDALVAAIERFMTLPEESRRAMGAAARRKMEAGFDRQRVVDRYVEEIGRALAARRVREV